MKTKIILSVIGCLLFILITFGSFAQSTIKPWEVTSELKAQTSTEVAFTALVTDYSKMADIGVVNNLNTIELIMVNAKALKNFRKYYNVNGEKWSKSKDCIVATFISDDIQSIIYYDTKGNWNGSVKIYQEGKMPKDIRKMIRQEYYDYKILAVQEVESAASFGPGEHVLKPTYIVTIQGESDIKRVRIQDDNMDVYQEFKKS